MSSDLLHTCSCPFLCLVMVLTWWNCKPDQRVKLNLSFVLTPNIWFWEHGVWVLWPRRKRRAHTPRVAGLECCHWQQVCCNQVYCHPLVLNTSPQVEGENKPRVSFSRRVPVTPCHRRWERLSCKWVRTPPSVGQQQGQLQGSGAVWKIGRGCSDKSLEVLGGKNLLQTPNSC